MQKDELRLCSVHCGWKKPIINGTEVIFEKKTRKAYFHKWAESYGIVEYEDGTVHRVSPECITFTDRKK